MRLTSVACLLGALFACSESGIRTIDGQPVPSETPSDTPATIPQPGTPAPGIPDPQPGTPTPDDPPPDDPPPDDPPDDPPPDDPPPDDPPDPPVDPNCWWEPYDPYADVSDLQAGFNSSNARSRMEEVLERRFPGCADLLVEMATDPYIDIFLDGSSWANAMDSLGTICHEETHGYDYQNSINPSYFSYWMLEDYIPQTAWIDGQPRSIIYPYIEGSDGDIYKNLYFVGTQGTYGFTELLDETTCYVNGLGGAMAGKDQGYSWGISARDGAVAFLYYIELYLSVVETQDPGLYAQLQADQEVKDLIRDLWLRTHFLLEFADQEPQLGIYDAGLRTLLYRSDNQGTLEDFLGYPLAASPCLP